MSDRTFPRTIARTAVHEIVVKKSRFICSLARAATEEEARTAIDSAKRAFWDANHNCSAYRVGPNGRFQRSNDDGEPAGTAGAPILAVLTRRDLTDVVAVVTRYFGGTLLGAGGLIRAYGHATTEAVDLAGIVERRPLALVTVTTGYDDAGKLENALRATAYALGDVRRESRVTFELRMDERELPRFQLWLAETTNGRCQALLDGFTVVEVPVVDP